MICPNCAADVDVTDPIANLVICPSCLRSLVIDADVLRLADGRDTTVLEPSQLAALRARRAKARNS